MKYKARSTKKIALMEESKSLGTKKLSKSLGTSTENLLCSDEKDVS